MTYLIGLLTLNKADENAVLEDIFPELKESEIERIRKAIKAIKEEKVDNANKVEPKFKVGDWIVDKSGFVQQVLDFRGGIYTCTYNSFTTDCESNYHLWTIEDAKDGDVLVSDNIIFIFNKIHDVWINCHCSTHKDGSFMEEDYDLMTIKYSKEVHPATKEQRELLFQKMKEAGYIWDVEKKEPKKIKDEFKNYKQQVMSEMTDLVKDYIRQKPTKWRPSNAQIGALEHFIRGIGESGHASSYDANLKLVHSLLNDLKKLKEE